MSDQNLYEKLAKKILQDSINIFLPVQVVPFSENPLLHVHWKDPAVLLHIALLEHGETEEEHSSISIIDTRKNITSLQNYVKESGQENIAEQQ